MSHPRSLLDAIVTKLASEYPSDVYEYAFERRLKLKGTSAAHVMLPDILISREGNPVCAVEIGYTRPEKLTAYRKAGIADVRWYDKQGDLHADVVERVVQVLLRVRPKGDVSIYTIEDQVQCEFCPGAWMRSPEVLERYARRFCIVDFDTTRHAELDDERQDVMTWAVTDHARVWLPSSCDKCGKSWFADPTHEAAAVNVDALADVSAARSEFGTRTQKPWDAIVEDVEQVFGLTLDYLEPSYCLVPGDEAALRSEIHSAVEAVKIFPDFALVNPGSTPKAR